MTVTEQPAPAAAAARPGSAAPGTLSPSRAGDFMTCPLLYRFRVIDRLPERPSAAAVRGTVVHAVLERLFDLPAAQRTLVQAGGMVEQAWRDLCDEQPDVATLFDGDAAAEAEWLASARDLLGAYFALEDPRALEPARREWVVQAELAGGLRLRGIVDRIDASPDGDLRVVDYKTGRSPAERFEGKALFQLKFYALALWRSEGVLPRLLQLMYLDNREVLRYAPDVDDLLATERKLTALWAAIERATRSGDWRPSPGPLCGWCDHKALCPAWGGTLPTLPEQVAAEVSPVPTPAGPGG